MKINDEAVKNIFDSMIGNIENEEIALYKKIIAEESPNLNIGDVEDFYYSLVYPYEKFLRGLINSQVSKNKDMNFLFLQSQFVERNFNKLISDIEGFACCSDKSRTIVRGLFNWINTGKKIEWNYSGEYTYHLPKKIFTTHEEIVEFYDGLKSLFYGNPKKYLVAMRDIIAKSKSETDVKG